MEYSSSYSLLSNKAIKRYYGCGEIIIEPYNEKSVGPNSYDVTLGRYFFREQPSNGLNIYNMYSQEDVKKV